ncbi:MAG: glycosyltransferase [Bdellovibrionales bacterium]|nr:glycosyltransferase [Bdellovibrionales bacterium]
MKGIPKKLSLININAPSAWPHLSNIQKSFKKHIVSLFPNIKDFQILSGKKPPIDDDLWIVPIGQTQPYLFSWLKKEFASPYKRPRMIFVLSGEGVKGGYSLYFHKELFRLDDEWLVSCEAEKKLLDSFFPGNNRTHILHYPVDPLFKPTKRDKKDLRKKLKLPLTRPIMLYAGRVSTQKNVFSLLDVLEKFKNLHIVVCGDADTFGLPHFNTAMAGHLPTEFITQIANRKLGDRIDFRGFVSQNELKEMMQACDYQISLSSHYGEDFGYSIAQGLCLGLKTVLTQWGGHLNWSKYFSAKELSYIPLEWSEGIGFPNIKDMILPKSSRINFPKEFHRDFSQQLFMIVTETDFTLRKINLVVSDEIAEYWSEVERENRTVMYKDHNDPLFLKVQKIYSE